MAVQTQIQTRRGTAASWTSTNPTLAAGEFGYETDTGKFKIGNGSTAWASLAYTAAATAVTYLFNATSGQTTFSGADANGLTLAYTVGAEQVYLNGVLQVRGSDYTASNGTSIVLASGALTSDVLNVIAYSAMTITDTYTQAQADARFVQQTNNFFAGKNKIINGDFSINQRSFTSITTSAQYGFDRWALGNIGNFGTVTYTPQTFTLGTAPVAGYEGKTFAQVVTTGQTQTNVLTTLRQPIESVRTFANQTVTVSFWAKAASGTPKIAVNLAQSFGTGGSPSSNVDTYLGQATLTTSWVRYSVTGAVPSIAGKTLGTSNNDYLLAELIVSAGTDFNAKSGSLGIQSNTFDIWGVQVEAGSIATPFQTATGTLAGELAACQRYYTRTSLAAFGPLGIAHTQSTTAGRVYSQYPVTMRTAPSFAYGGTITLGTGSFSSLTGDRYTTTAAMLALGGSSFIAGGANFLYDSGSGTAYFEFSSEL